MSEYDKGGDLKRPKAKMVAVASEGVVVHPGDTLLLRVTPDSTPDQVERFKDELVEQLPDVRVLVVACEQFAVERGSGTTHGDPFRALKAREGEGEG